MSTQMVSTGFTDIRVSSNHFTGTLSPNWCLMPLIQLDVSYNQLSGVIPSCYSSSYLWINDNQLSGSIPSYFFVSNKFTTLEYHLHDNQLVGTIPYLISNVLNYLSLYNNMLSGTLPSFQISGGQLNVVQASFNQLSGTIPSRWVGLGEIDVGSNRIDGPLPAQLWSVLSLKALTVLMVNDNMITSSLLGVPYVYTQTSKFHLSIIIYDLFIFS